MENLEAGGVGSSVSASRRCRHSGMDGFDNDAIIVEVLKSLRIIVQNQKRGWMAPRTRRATSAMVSPECNQPFGRTTREGCTSVGIRSRAAIFVCSHRHQVCKFPCSLAKWCRQTCEKSTSNRRTFR